MRPFSQPFGGSSRGLSIALFVKRNPWMVDPLGKMAPVPSDYNVINLFDITFRPDGFWPEIVKRLAKTGNW